MYSKCTQMSTGSLMYIIIYFILFIFYYIIYWYYKVKNKKIYKLKNINIKYFVIFGESIIFAYGFLSIRINGKRRFKNRVSCSSLCI